MGAAVPTRIGVRYAIKVRIVEWVWIDCQRKRPVRAAALVKHPKHAIAVAHDDVEITVKVLECMGGGVRERESVCVCEREKGDSADRNQQGLT